MAAASCRAELYLITGSYNQGWNYSSGSVLLEVGDKGVVREKTTLVSPRAGFVWVRMDYEAGLAAVLVPDKPHSVRIIGLKTANIRKDCQLPSHDLGSESWFADIPGVGVVIESQSSSQDVSHDPMRLFAFRADPAIPCTDSLQEVPVEDIRYALASGMAGVGDFIMGDSYDADVTPSGMVLKWMGAGHNVTLDFHLPKELTGTENRRVVVYASNPAILLATTAGTSTDQRTLVLRRRDNRWLPLSEPLASGYPRAFGKYVAVTEIRMKAHPGRHEMNMEGEEQSPGRDKWRSEYGPFGPSLAESFESSMFVFPGRLHVFDTDTQRTFTINTKQGDSEILLIDGGMVYYRVSNRIYRAPITKMGIGPARLMAEDERIGDAHWAFTSR
jgi:hypothetical protein